MRPPLPLRLLPLVLLGAGWIVGGLVLERPAAFHAVVLSSLAAGRWVVASGTLDIVPFSTLELIGISVFCDGCLGTFVAMNADILRRLPFVGGKLRELEARGHALLTQRKRLRNAATIGVFVVVFLPLPGTGAIGGAVLARSLGMSLRRSLTVIGGAIVISTLTIAYGAEMVAWIALPRPGERIVWLALRVTIIAAIIGALALSGHRALRAEEKGAAP